MEPVEGGSAARYPIDEAWDKHCDASFAKWSAGLRDSVGRGSLLGEFLREVIAPLHARVVSLTEEVNALSLAEVERSHGIRIPDGLVEAVAMRVAARLKYMKQDDTSFTQEP